MDPLLLMSPSTVLSSAVITLWLELYWAVQSCVPQSEQQWAEHTSLGVGSTQTDGLGGMVSYTDRSVS